VFKAARQDDRSRFNFGDGAAALNNIASSGAKPGSCRRTEFIPLDRQTFWARRKQTKRNEFRSTNHLRARSLRLRITRLDLLICMGVPGRCESRRMMETASLRNRPTLPSYGTRSRYQSTSGKRPMARGAAGRLPRLSKASIAAGVGTVRALVPANCSIWITGPGVGKERIATRLSSLVPTKTNRVGGFRFAPSV